MNRRSFLQLPAAAALAAGSRMNCVVILADDLGWADTGFNGSDFYQTPELDRLARQGMRFTDAYAACPVCSPTRASIMTGKYPARVGITNFIPGRSPRRYARLVPPDFDLQLAPEETTVAEALKSAGYRTAAIGKWHLGGDGFGPERQGFDVAYSTGGRHLASQWTVNAPHSPVEGQHQWEALAAQAERFLDSSRQAPFFLYFALHLPHIPLQSLPELIAKYEARLRTPRFRDRAAAHGPAQNHPVYAAMLECMDAAVGRVLRKLDETGLAQNTAVFFLSDNGGLSAPEFENRPTTSNAPFREGKGHVYEGGIRVPLVVRWPGVVKAGAVSNVPVSSVDLYPTLLDIAGAPDLPGHRGDGESLAGLLRGAGAPRREALYWHYPHYSNQGGDPAGAVREGDWKLIEFYEDHRTELYDLRKDPGESRDLARALPERAARMRRRLDAWRREVGARMPTPNPDYDPARQREGLRWVRPAVPVA